MNEIDEPVEHELARLRSALANERRARRAAEDEARSARGALEVGAAAWLVVDREGAIVQASDAARRLLGIPRSAEACQPRHAILDASSRALSRDRSPLARAGLGEHLELERARIELPGGASIPIEISSMPSRAGDRALCVFREIELLGAGVPAGSQAWLDAVPEMTWSCGPDAIADSASADYRAWLGLPEGRSKAFDPIAWVHPDDAASHLDAWVDARRTGSFHVEERLRRADGAYRWTESHARQLSHRWIGVTHDVTDARRASAERDAILAAAPFGIALYDRELRFAAVNEALAEMNGVPSAVHLGRRHGEIGLACDARLERALRDAIETGRSGEDVFVGAPDAGRVPEAGMRTERVRAIRLGAETIGVAEIVLDESAGRRERAALETLARVGWALGSSSDPRELAACALAAIVPRLGEAAWIAVGTEAGLAPLAHCHADPRLEIALGEAVRLSLDPAGMLATAHRAGRHASAALDALASGGPDGPLGAALRAIGITHWICAPIRSSGRALGVLAVAALSAPDDAGLTVQLAREIALRAGAALERAELHARAERDRRHYQFLAEASRIVGASLESDATIASLLDLAVGALGDHALLYALEDGRLEIAGVAHVDPARRDALRGALVGAAVRRHALRTGAIAALRSRKGVRVAVPPPHQRPDGGTGTSYLSVPIRSRGEISGVLSIGASPGRPRDEADLVQAEELALIAGVALEHARLFEEAQRHRARAEAASRAKDVFLGMVSHELRTPLNAILGWSQMLLAGAIPPARRRHALEVVTRNARSLAEVVEDLLDATRAATGQLRLHLEAVEPEAILAAGVDTMRPIADEKGVGLVLSSAPGVRELRGDASRLTQVVTNLIGNAIKFTPAGGHVRVTLREEGEAVEIVVEDDGAGIPPEFLPHVFEPFRQAEAGVARARSGLGLGLAIVRTIVELHGGAIGAESEGRGQGARFRVRIPVDDHRVPPEGDPLRAGER